MSRNKKWLLSVFSGETDPNEKPNHVDQRISAENNSAASKLMTFELFVNPSFSLFND